MLKNDTIQSIIAVMVLLGGIGLYWADTSAKIATIETRLAILEEQQKLSKATHEAVIEIRKDIQYMTKNLSKLEKTFK